MSPHLASSALRITVLGGLVACALASRAAAQGDSWEVLAPLPTPRRLLAAAKHGEKIYTFGGCGSPCFAPPLHTSTTEERTVEVYDRASNSWSARRPMPAIVYGAAAATLGDRIYLLGGFVTDNLTQVYDPDPQADSWIAGAAMPTPRHGLAAVTLDGLVYAIGGSNGTTALATVEAYEPGSNTWRTRASMRTARAFLGAAVLGGRIYAIGGSPGCCGEGVTDAVEIYDPETNSWSPGTPLPTALQTSAVAALGGKIYVLGGFIPGQGAQGTTFELDPAAPPDRAWTPKTPLPEGKERDQAPAVTLGDTIHLLGGAKNCHCSALGDHHGYVVGVPHLLIEKTGDPPDACPGETITYAITLINDGTAPVRGALVTDEVDPSLLVSSWSCTPPASPGTSCSTDPALPGAPVRGHADLPPGGSVTYRLVGTLDVDARDELRNVAEAWLPEHEPQSSTADATSDPVVTLIRRDRLTITKTRTESPGSTPPSEVDRVFYEIRVSNGCRIPLRVTTEDQLSTAGLIDPRWCLGAGCDPQTPAGFVDLATVPPLNSITYMASGVPCNCAASGRNVASASAPGQDPDPVRADAEVPPRKGDNLQLVIAGPAVLAGCGGDYAITVSNLGPCTAENVVLELPAPPDLSLVSVAAPCRVGSPCALGDIAAGAAVTVAARFEVAAGLQCPIGPRSIVARAGSLCSQPLAPALEAAIAAAIPCDVIVTKTDGLADAAPGDCISYSIEVANQGCGAVAGARVTDIFPPELAALWCRGGPSCNPAVSGNIVDTVNLPRSATVSYKVAGTISPSFIGPLSNGASVELGDNAANANVAVSTATDVTDVVPRPGVDAQCTGTPDRVAEGDGVTFTFVLWNGGPAAQGDNPGDEFIDVLPAGLTLVSAVATSGTITILPVNTVHWNGAIPVNGMVTIEVTATVDLGTIGMSFCNTPTVFSDTDGDGINESSAPTDDRCHPCCFTVTGVLPIPALSPLGLVLLALLVAALGVTRLRPRARGQPPS